MRDQLPDLASRASDATHPPPFEDLVRRGRRLRRTRTAGAGVAVAGVLALSVLGVQAVFHDQAGPVQPAQPTASPLPSPPLIDHSSVPLEDLTLKQIVYDENAEISDAIAVPSGGPDATASLWSVCRKSTCARALALTQDGFATASYADPGAYANPSMADVGGGSVLVADRGFKSPTIVVSPDGTTKVLRPSTAPSPMADGEVLLDGLKWTGYRQQFFTTMSPVAIDAASGTSHPISLPEEGAFAQLTQSGPSALWGSSYSFQTGEAAAIWSDDGGATWREHVLTPDAQKMGILNVPGGPDSMLAIALVSHESNADTQLHRSLDGGRSWEMIALAGDARSTDFVGGVVAADGSLLLELGKRGSDVADPTVGLVGSDGKDWSALGQVDAPFANGTDVDELGFSLASSDPYAVEGSTALYGYRSNRLWRSTDNGETWTEQPTR